MCTPGAMFRPEAQRGMALLPECCRTSQWSRLGDFWRQLPHKAVALGAFHMMLNDKTYTPQNPRGVFLGLHHTAKDQKG